MTGRMTGKTAVVVGAGQSPGPNVGNGRATALLLAREGAQLMCVDRDEASAAETVAMIAAEGGQAWAWRADVARRDDCEALVKAARERMGRIDALVNNVGIGGGGDGPAHRAEEAAWDRILTVNLKSMWMTIKYAVPVMREQGGGAAIVNISSLASIAGGNMVAYEVSKAGVNRLTTSVAATTATSTPGIRGHWRLKRSTMARDATPMAQLVQLVSPCATPCTRLMLSCTSPSPLAEKPRILGSCPTSTVSAMPLT